MTADTDVPRTIIENTRRGELGRVFTHSSTKSVSFVPRACVYMRDRYAFVLVNVGALLYMDHLLTTTLIYSGLLLFGGGSQKESRGRRVSTGWK